MRAGRDELGAATVLAVTLAGVLLLLGAALVVVAGMFADHRRAQSAADLAALAGAAALRSGVDPCTAAGRITTANDARMASCRVSGRDVEVTVRVDGPRWRDWAAEFEGRARAGPTRPIAA